jgi:hypothetical protein
MIKTNKNAYSFTEIVRRMLVMAATENLEMELVNRIFSVSDGGRTMLDCNDHDAENSHFILIGCADCNWQ